MVRIHAVLASPQQLHQYCVQLRNWQRSSVLQARQREQLPRPGHSLLLEGGAEHTHTLQPTHTLTHTHTHPHWSLCCIKRQKRRLEEGPEGRTDWEYSGGQSCRGTGLFKGLVRLCFRTPQGKLVTREFDRISVHLLRVFW